MDRRCSNCKHLEERIGMVDRILISQGYPREPRYYKWCTLTNSQIKNENVDTLNCVNFKRKYGTVPIKQKIRSFERWSKKQWGLHYKIISFVVGTILTIIAILISYFLAKGLI
jgi:hypothetical protein